MKNRNNIKLPAFVLLALIQLAIPLWMIARDERVLREGKLFRIKTIPVDPNDPYRGKYINLQFEISRFPADSAKAYDTQAPIYVSLEDNDSGYAKITTASQSKPKQGDYIKAELGYISQDEATQMLVIYYPFDRYYLNEYKAKAVEDAYFRGTTESYAIVKVLNGRAKIEALFIEGKAAEAIFPDNPADD